jgi:hypothetical protein
VSFLSQIFRNSVSNRVEATEPTNSEVAEHPALFAAWTNKSLVLGLSFERDLDCFAPDEEACTRLSISQKERILAANECVLLRALGACLFVRNNLDELYYLEFKKELLPPVIERMSRNAPYGHYENPEAALDQYMEELKSDSHVGFSLFYIQRVYPETPSSQGIFMQGIPVNLILKEVVMTTAELVRDYYAKLKTGLGYEELKVLHEKIQAVECAEVTVKKE